MSSLRHRDGTVSVSLMCGGLEFEVAQIVEFEEITRRWCVLWYTRKQTFFLKFGQLGQRVHRLEGIRIWLGSGGG